jgi:hypothetical protein
MLANADCGAGIHADGADLQAACIMTGLEFKTSLMITLEPVVRFMAVLRC